MKNNKLLVFICIILILTIFIQLIYFNNKSYLQEPEEKEESEGIIINIDEFYKYYSEINISKNKLEKAIYKFVTEDLSLIMNETKENGPEQNIDYYNSNAINISNIGIKSKDDFILIAEDLKNCTNSDNAKIYEIKTEFEDEYAKENEYYTFNLIIKYTNSAMSNIKCQIPVNNMGTEKKVTTNNDNFTIYYSSNSELAKINNKYNGSVKIVEMINTINNFQNSLKEIYDNTSFKSINSISQYYNDNKEHFNSLGITSENDFKELVYQIKNDIIWQGPDSHYYRLDISEDYEEEEYIGYKLTILYNYSDNLDVIFYLNKSSNELNKIKISGTKDGGI